MPIGVAEIPTLAVLLVALVLDCAIGDPAWLYRAGCHPVQWIGRIVAALDRRLNRPERSERTRLARGAVVAILTVCLAIGAGLGLETLIDAVPWGWAIEIVAVTIMLAARSLFDHVRAVAIGLAAEGVAGGREAVALIVGRDPATLDEHGVARAAIESAAENFADGVVAPAFWYALLGLPGLFAYKAVNTLDSMIGHRDPQYLAFGRLAARADDVANIVPARIAALLIAVAAPFVPGGSASRAVRIAFRDARHHRSPNAGWPEAAAAGGLGIALGGPRRYPGLVVDDPWLGDGSARATAADINRMLYLYVLGNFFGWVVVAALAVALAY